MHSFPFNPLDRFYGTTSSSSGTSSTKGHQRLRGRAFDFCSFLMRKQRERETTLFIQQSHLGRNGPVERFPNGKRTRRNSAIFLGFRSVRRDWSKWSTPPSSKKKKAANQLRSSTQRWWKSNFRAPAPVWLSLTNYRLPTMPKYRYSGSDHVPLVLTFEAPSFFFSTNKTRCQLSITNQGSSFKYRYLKSNPQLVFSFLVDLILRKSGNPFVPLNIDY